MQKSFKNDEKNKNITPIFSALIAQLVEHFAVCYKPVKRKGPRFNPWSERSY